MKNKQPSISEGDFYASIERAMIQGNHVEYLHEVLNKYEYYKKEFAKIFTDKNPIKDIYTFRVRYHNKKTIWRDIELPGDHDFEDLAREIIDSMGWDNDHMHGFELSEYDREQDPLITGSSLAFFAEYWEDDPHPTFKTNDILICDLDYKKQPSLEFTFDYGDGHTFTVTYQGKRKRHEEDNLREFPCLIDQRGVGPEQYPPLPE
jgi:hypothetical protein